MINENQKYQIAFYEVNEIIENMPKDLSNKIPQKFKNFLDENKIEEHEFKFTKKDTLSTVQLTKETKILLSLIYRNFLVSDEKKKELYEKDKQILEDIYKKRAEQYSYENLFKSKNIENEFSENIHDDTKDICTVENALIEYKKENIFTKIINKIKQCLKIKVNK